MAGGLAAGILACAAGAAYLMPSGNPETVIPADLSAAQPHPASGAIRTPKDKELILSLPDGSRIRVGSETVLQFQRPKPGRRVEIDLRHGSVDVWAAAAQGEFRVRAEGGEILVLGTRFTARALTLSGAGVLSGFQGGPALCVDVKQGAVRLENYHGAVRIAGGARGTAFPCAAPIQQEQGAVARILVDRFAQAVQWEGGEPRVFPGDQDGVRMLVTLFHGFRSEEETRSLRAELDGAGAPTRLRHAYDLLQRLDRKK